MTLTEDILKPLPGVLQQLRSADRLLASYRENTAPIPEVIKHSHLPLETMDWDVIVCGGTLGIFIGCALAQRGWRVALIERGMLRGRQQEWNISRQELEVFLELNLLTAEELEQAIATQYNPARVSFLNGCELWVQDVLNIGIDPVFLLETLKTKFLGAGGSLYENTSFEGAVIHPDGVVVDAGKQFKSRLLIDAMGHLSPIGKQARLGQKPDGICLVVGSCAQGFPNNESGDLLVSFTPIQHQCQYFWEAFPARDGRTTYLFTYMDADPQHLNLEALFDEYLRLMPQYQGVELNQIKLQRALFGFFPSYRQSPLRLPWSRILPVGDSSGSQSPLSFGGFGSMVRHLKRLTIGINNALSNDLLDAQALKMLQPYQPSLSVTWLFQTAMRCSFNQKIAPEQINQLLSVVFLQMNQLGDSVLKPFLQDVVQFSALTQTLLRTAIANPALVAQVIPQVGLPCLLDWMVHYLNLGVYSALFKLSQMLEPWSKNLSPVAQYYYHCWVEAWHYGSGGDYSSQK